MLPSSRVAEVTERFAARGCRVDTWDVFAARAEEALAPSRAILAKGLPDDVAMLDLPRDAEHEAVRRVQAFMAANGVMSFSGSMLVGEYGPAVTIAFIEGQGSLVAAAHCYFAHNEHSPYHRAAWAGLVVVAPSQRGRGLGRYDNACIVTAAFDRLGAESVHELVSSANQASRRMVEACGLRLDPSVKCAVASRQGERFTR
jgi:GNAT superfamily N-acetyltransferase